MSLMSPPTHKGWSTMPPKGRAGHRELQIRLNMLYNPLQELSLRKSIISLEKSPAFLSAEMKRRWEELPFSVPSVPRLEALLNDPAEVLIFGLKSKLTWTAGAGAATGLPGCPLPERGEMTFPYPSVVGVYQPA